MAGIASQPGRKTLTARILRYRYVYALMMPGILFMLIFRFLPMWGLILSVKEYNPFSGGILGGKWYGLKYFIELFSDKYFYYMARNTIAINLLRIVFFFPLPIILAMMLSEVRHEAFKRINQSIVYLPHFLSWVVIASMTSMLLSTDIGIFNKLLRGAGMHPIAFLSDPKLFWPLMVGQTIWRDTGWGTILFLAAITGIDPQLYEAAVIDGATRMQQILKITLPGIIPTIVILLIIRVGQIASLPLEQVLLMQNPLVMEVSEVFDTYAFNQGIMRGQISIGVAVGLIKGLIGVIFIVSTNKLMKKLGFEGLY